MRNTKSSTILPITTNTTIDTSKQTPIEIALQIDENGMTSLKNLYEFLELEQKNYARWCKRNILDNPFATENRFILLTIIITIEYINEITIINLFLCLFISSLFATNTSENL